MLLNFNSSTHYAQSSLEIARCLNILQIIGMLFRYSVSCAALVKICMLLLKAFSTYSHSAGQAVNYSAESWVERNMTSNSLALLIFKPDVSYSKMNSFCF